MVLALLKAGVLVEVGRAPWGVPATVPMWLTRRQKKGQQVVAVAG
jgi:hypothetical protein